MRNSASATGVGLAGLAVGTLLSVLPAQAQELESLSIMLSNNNTTNLYPHVVARDLGLYEKAGLKVTTLDSETTVPYVAFLSNGDADIVMLDAPQTFQAVNAKQPIKVIYEAMQNAPEVLAVVDTSDITSLDQLKGKVIGLASDRDQITAQVVLDTAGISIDEVQTVVVGDSGPVVAKALKDNQIQAIASAVNDLAVLAPMGIKTRDLTPPEVKVNPANTFSVWVPRMEELRPRLEKFFRVWAAATAAAKIDRDAVARICAKAVPEEWENKDAGEALLDASIALNFPVTEKFGDVEPEVWAKVQAPYIKFGQIEGQLDPATFLDGSFIDYANGFSEDEMKAALEEWKAANPS